MEKIISCRVDKLIYMCIYIFPSLWDVTTLLLRVNVGQLFSPKILIFFSALNTLGGTLLCVNFT